MPDTVRRRLGLMPGALLAVSEAHGEWGINFPEPAWSGAQQIYDVHMLTFWISTVLMLIITAVVAYSVFVHRKSRGFEADQNFNETWFGRWGWISVPVLVLGVDLTIAGSAQRTLETLWMVPNDKTMMDVKVTGHQWWWEYDYIDHGIKLESRYTPEEQAGDHYLREVDNALVLPTHTPIRFLHTSADVLHAFWVPALGFKKDAIPGYITETWAEIEKEGVYRGQCAELCGTWHARMPVVVKAVSPEAFDVWLSERKEAMQAAALEAASDRQWSKEELIARGKVAYESKCASCHQANGAGLPPAFPALKGNKVVMGPIDDHIRVIVEGRPGTAMQAWNTLNDLEIAAIVTYERNAWGNDTGDIVQPLQVSGTRTDIRPVAR